MDKYIETPLTKDKVRNTEIKMAGGLTYGSVNRW